MVTSQRHQDPLFLPFLSTANIRTAVHKHARCRPATAADIAHGKTAVFPWAAAALSAVHRTPHTASPAGSTLLLLLLFHMWKRDKATKRTTPLAAPPRNRNHVRRGGVRRTERTCAVPTGRLTSVSKQQRW